MLYKQKMEVPESFCFITLRIPSSQNQVKELPEKAFGTVECYVIAFMITESHA